MTDAQLLEDFVPLSQSRLWDLQRRYYDQRGPRAWQSHEVPHYVTGNAVVGASYAAVIAAFADDVRGLPADHPLGGLDPERPIDVVELGSGAGRNGFLLARALEEKRRALGLPRFRVILTDFTQRNVDAWQRRPELVRLARQGLVDFAVFDADAPAPLQLRRSGETLGEGPGNPIVVVANYVFDTLRQDAYDVRDGRLLEIRYRARLPADRDPGAQDASAWVELERRKTPIEPAPDRDPLVEGLLARYRDALRRAEVLVPVGGLAAVRYLLGLRQHRGLVVAGDKGYGRLVDLEGRSIGTPSKHGSFSYMVNFDAFGVLAERHGGFALTESARRSRFTVAAFAFPGGEPAPLPRLRDAYEDRVDRFGPSAYHRLFRAVREQAQPPDLDALLVLLRASDFDPVLFARFGDHLLTEVAKADEETRRELIAVIDRVLERTYPVGAKDDALFISARLLFAMKRSAEAGALFERVTREQPSRRAGWFNLGTCHEALGDRAGAAAAYQKAIDLDPTYTKAATALARVRARA